MFKSAKLTPDDFEQLAAAFRPSWELDDAPFTGAGAMSPADAHALQNGGGTHFDVRPAAQSPNGAYPAAGVTGQGPERAVVAERGITAAHVAAVGALPSAPAPALTPHGPPIVMAPAMSQPLGQGDRFAKTRLVDRRTGAPMARESTGSFDLAAASFRSRGPMWMGLGVCAIALIGAGVWVTQSKQTSHPTPDPVMMAKTVEAVAPAIPPPPPETTAAAVTPPPKTVPPAAAAPPALPAPVQATAAAPALPVARQSVVVAPAPARAAVAPVPRPVARAKGTTATIVHDVPF
jgi:hypothetical protein